MKTQCGAAKIKKNEGAATCRHVIGGGRSSSEPPDLLLRGKDTAAALLAGPPRGVVGSQLDFAGSPEH